MTYSIVALDKNTGELGAAVQSHWFNPGGNVPLVEGRVGAHSAPLSLWAARLQG